MLLETENVLSMLRAYCSKNQGGLFCFDYNTMNHYFSLLRTFEVDLHACHIHSYFSLTNKFQSFRSFETNFIGINNKTLPFFSFIEDCLPNLNIILL